jgi:peptidoglycan/LPS O-acetylase OafA/YrhL
VPGLFGFAALCILIYSLNIKAANRFILYTSRISFAIFLNHFLVLKLMQAACRAIGISWTWVMLIPTLTFCWLAAIPLQRFFDYLNGIMITGPRNQPVGNEGKKN